MHLNKVSCKLSGLPQVREFREKSGISKYFKKLNLNILENK